MSTEAAPHQRLSGDALRSHPHPIGGPKALMSPFALGLLYLAATELTGGACAADIPGVTLGPSEWPEGCLGYAINLVRPVLQGHRASLLYPMLGQSLVRRTSHSTDLPRPPSARLPTGARSA